MSGALRALGASFRALVLLAALLVPSSAFGAGFAIVEQSAVAGGTAGAGVARAWDPAAAWYNPAALAFRPGLHVSAGLLVVAPRLEAAALDGSWRERTESPPRLPPHVYLSYGRGPFAAGLAFNVPFGSSVVWPETWRGRYVAVSSQLQVLRFSPFLAWRFWRIGIAAGLQVDLGSLAIRRQLDFVDAEGRVAIELQDNHGLGGHASIFVDATPWLSIGASYKSRTSFALEGNARFDVPLAFSGKAQDQRATAAYHLPDLLTLGAELRPGPRWSAVLDLGLTLWSVYDQLLVDFENPATTDVKLRAEWRPRLSVRGGGEFRPLPWLATRLGLFYDPTPVPPDTLPPSSPDSNRLGLSFGLGARLPWGLSVDAFYSYVHLFGQESSASEVLIAHYSGSLHLAGVGVRFEPRSR